jgi:hypothetical protein
LPVYPSLVVFLEKVRSLRYNSNRG